MSERGLKQVDVINLAKPYFDDVKITKTDLSQYVNDKTEPRQDKMYILSKALNVNEAWLMGFNVEKERIPDWKRHDDIISIYEQLEKNRQKKVYSYAEKQLEDQIKLKTVKVYGQTAAGDPITYGDDIVEEKEASYIPSGADIALVVKGDSMEPEIEDGSIVFYKRQPNIENGEIAVVEIDGNGVTCKKVKFDYDNKKIILQSLNDKYEDQEFESGQIRILGKVVK